MAAQAHHKMSHCWKSDVAAHLFSRWFAKNATNVMYLGQPKRFWYLLYIHEFTDQTSVCS